MKFKKYSLLLLFICFITGLTGCKEEGLQTIKVAEVAHSVFYAPQYVAIELGYFEEEGLKVDLYNANGADKVTASLLSGSVQIGLQGPEPTIYLYNNDQSNYLINFAQLTQTDGSFIFGREPVEDFDITMLKGKSILGGRLGGVPLMTLEYVIKNAGLTVSHNELTADVNVRTDVAFPAMAGSFLSGEGDFTTLFEPTASELVLNKKAYLLESVGRLAGEVAYTAYSTSKSYFEKNEETLTKFTKAIYKGQLYVLSHTDEEVAKVIQPQFDNISLEVLTSVVTRYRSINAWAKTPVFSEKGFEKLQDIMILAEELKSRIKFKTIVDNKIALKVAK